MLHFIVAQLIFKQQQEPYGTNTVVFAFISRNSLNSSLLQTIPYKKNKAFKLDHFPSDNVCNSDSNSVIVYALMSMCSKLHVHSLSRS